MTIFEFVPIALGLEALLYLLLLAIALKRGNRQERVVQVLALYTALSALWVGYQFAWQLGWLDGLGINPYLAVRLPLYGLLLLALLFLFLTRFFLRLPWLRWKWILLGVVWIALLAILDSNPLGLPEGIRLPIGQSLNRLTLTFGAAVVGWGLFMGAPLPWFIRAYRRTQLPLHRNRLTYWPLAWGLTLAGDLLFFAGQQAPGSDVRLLGTLVTLYAVVTHRLPDMRRIAQRTLSSLIITLLTIAIYTAGFTAVQYLFQGFPGYSPLWAGATVALLLAILFDPLLRVVQRLVERFIAGSGYDPRRIVSEYSLSISNILDLDRLADVALSTINQTLNIRRGALFLVRREEDLWRGDIYRLLGVRGMEDGIYLPPQGALSASSPVARYLCTEHRPLTQYDLDLLPQFQGTPAAERSWLASLGMDLYIPIHAKEKWIGLLALGPKLSRDRYFDEDLLLLGTLADQTAVALENARLVDDLIKLNQELQRAYAALASANRQLQEMDRLKSGFIGVITHELRSPFANLAFSLELLKRYGLGNLTPEQQEQLEQLSNGLKAARTLVDNLVTLATFFSKRGELNLSQVDVLEVLQEAIAPLEVMARTKGLAFHLLVPDRLPPVRGDRERLADAIHHLVHNAIKFTPAGGQVWVRCQVEAGTLHFEVKDTGVGVPAGRLPGLWEGFTQMADPLRRGVEGLGLGLALVRYIVLAHGGQVRAESREGRGSTFGFQVPVTGPRTPTLAEVTAPAAPSFQWQGR